MSDSNCSKVNDKPSCLDDQPLNVLSTVTNQGSLWLVVDLG